MAVGGEGAWSHDLTCAKQKGSESFQDVSVVHLDDDLRGGVVAGDRVKPNRVLSTLACKLHGEASPRTSSWRPGESREL